MKTDIEQRLEKIAERLEKARLSEYLAYVGDWKRQYCTIFFNAIVRGIGFMIGFTVIGALLVTLLRHIVMDNITGIGGFLAEVVNEMQKRTG